MTDRQRVADEPGIVLHSRPYRETSLIFSVLTLHHGRVGVVAKGARGSRRGRSIQPFCRVLLGWSGRSGLVTLTGYELQKQYWFQGNQLACAFYLAELTTRLLDEREAHPRLFAGLEWALQRIHESPALVLRSFEKLLLEELGYGLDFQRDLNGLPLQAEGRYRLLVDRGFVAAEDGHEGRVLLQIGQGNFVDPEVRRAARTLFREALAAHLGPKPLQSRRLLIGGG